MSGMCECDNTAISTAPPRHTPSQLSTGCPQLLHRQSNRFSTGYEQVFHRVRETWWVLA